METSWRVRARQFAMCTYNKCTFRCIVEALVQDRDRLGSQAACKRVTGQPQLSLPPIRLSKNSPTASHMIIITTILVNNNVNNVIQDCEDADTKIQHFCGD